MRPSPGLRERFPRARLVGVDAALPMLRAARGRTPWWRGLAGRTPLLACADAERLPLAHGSAQLAFSNLMLQWCDAAAVFTEAARVLEAGGLLLFSTYGPDTLKELRAAFAAFDDARHVNAFVDMHDLGDALVAAGFADPVMEMETITLEYASVEALARDLKAGGGHNRAARTPPGARRPRGLAPHGRALRNLPPRRRPARDVRGGLWPRVEGRAAKASPTGAR